MTPNKHISNVNVIDIPRKVWLPRVKSQFRPEARYDDIGEGYFLFERYGKAVFRSTPWEPGKRNDVISFEPKLHQDSIDKLQIDEGIPSVVR